MHVVLRVEIVVQYSVDIFQVNDSGVIVELPDLGVGLVEVPTSHSK